jgi:hypothetical protein
VVLECVTGDWQYTTDSTCLSKKSQDLEAALSGWTLQDKTELLQRFYNDQNDVDKTNDEIAKIAYKYRHDFPKLVSKLERKYGNNSFPNIASFRKRSEEGTLEQEL